MLYSTILAYTGLATQAAVAAAAACSRAQLQAVTATYIDAQTKGDSEPLIYLFSTDVKYAENDKQMNINGGMLSRPLKIDFHRSIYDTAQCATFTELTAASGPHPYVIHTRMMLLPRDDDEVLEIMQIESVVTDEGDWAFNATSHLSWTQREVWEPIVSPGDARETIQAAADAYLDQWGNATLPVPLGTPCARLEGGLYTGSSAPDENTCAMGAFPQPLAVDRRRYIIDKELGAVDVFMAFPWLEASLPPDATMPSSNLLRVEEGLIRYIHEVTVCKTPQCGR